MVIESSVMVHPIFLFPSKGRRKRLGMEKVEFERVFDHTVVERENED